MNKNCGIYLVTNKINGHYYGGSSNNIRRRWADHKRLARKGSIACRRLYSALRKYGECNFSIDVLSECDENVLFEHEQVWLDKHTGKKECYNLSKCAKAPTRGLLWTEEQKQKIRGRKLSPEHREKISRGMIGKNTWMVGRTLSDSTKQKISERTLGKKKSVKTVRKMKLSQKGSGNGASKLTESDVLNIKKRYIPYKVTQKMLGNEYGVSEDAIGAIIRNENWSHM